MDTSSAYNGSASYRQIVVISNLTKVVDQSEPIPAHCVIKVLKLYLFFFLLKPTSEIALF